MNRRNFCRSAAAFLATAHAGARAAPFDAELGELAARLDGVLVRPEDDAYADARRAASFNPRFDRYPLAIVGVRSESDIARAIGFARDNDLPLAIRSGGHDVLAASICDGGVVIDTRFLTMTSIDEQNFMIRIGGGSLAGGVNAAAGRAGLAVPLGCNGRVGVSGLTLGGGIGWFAGNRGASCDHVERIRLVTADGVTREVDAVHEPDLYWALRGGGGNFGVVSEWTFRAFRQPEVVCGGIVFTGEAMSEFLAFYREFVASSPDELTVEVIGNAYREPMVAAAVCYSGDPAEADDVLRPLRGFHRPLADGIASRPYAELESVPPEVAEFLASPGLTLNGEPAEPGSYWQGTTIADLSAGAIREIGAAIADAPPGWSFGLGHVMRGALLRNAGEQTPLSRPPGAVTVHFDAGWSHRSQAQDSMHWVDAATARLRDPADGTPAYVNYLSSDHNSDVRRAFGRHYDRLAQIKARFDPDNVFQGNRNIPPAV